MTLTINGKQQEFGGCRSFVSVAQLIGLLACTQQGELVVGVNGKRIESQNFSSVQVSSGDKINISAVAQQS